MFSFYKTNKRRIFSAIFTEQLKKMDENCDLGNREEKLIRDILITIIIESDLQSPLLKKPSETEHALELAINQHKLINTITH